MDELHVVPAAKTVVEFKKLWQDLEEQGWHFVSTLKTEDEGEVMVFKRPVTGLEATGL